jgi:cytosine/adenosine deaminase-related metal-dependent hydrolase
MLAAGRASVVYCPWTHEFFGHPEHRFREMQRMGINVAVGTDSCASSPNLNIVDDLRLLHARYPGMDVQELWRMATVNGARALWREGDAGSLAIGKFTDLVAFPAVGDDPLREVLEHRAMPAGVWIAGDRVV